MSESATPVVTPPPQRLYTVSCHCGGVKFQAQMEKELTKGHRCNCSSCFKTRMWVHPVSDLSTFKMMTPEENVSQYVYNTKMCEHYFCKTCGTQTHMMGDCPGYGRYILASINCLEELTQEEFSNIKFRYADGINSNFMDVPKYTNHL
ncbi:hypothetical protein SAMD00019534_052420 [Acytostelium subglobosum LB1]|uniref:hypothetical protein n=1 Tax=Acytostelium subglobosum LB1 TaxID=1410327 RepID=UPI00064504F6|nr:hypothetical protein SAMD00019534_052420 [Acytostelium subglobosum LB1]GAM22067.1 hypothetical protein SAMD00019534_052420 [Acytostelium subglobosum LB1]|eukprot:XP_012755167.1 hypothetical protein SAMD00019534_052420 [Acytostelium subglobosum LB1]